MPRAYSLFSFNRNKKGIELSINFLVIIILSIVIFSLGLIMVRTFFTKTAEIKSELDTQTKAKISEMLSGGEPTAVPFNKKTISAGNMDVFGIGIMNIRKEPQNFQIKIESKGGFEKGTQDQIEGDFSTWLLYDEEPFSLDPYEKNEIPVLVSVPNAVEKGTYVFDVSVTANGQQYTSPHKIYVEVP
jgi:hypothetical protein